MMNYFALGPPGGGPESIDGPLIKSVGAQT